ncbi:hypothetical protein MTO96_002509 [Rhipicephalus appendiculatus]
MSRRRRRRPASQASRRSRGSVRWRYAWRRRFPVVFLSACCMYADDNGHGGVFLLSCDDVGRCPGGWETRGTRSPLKRGYRELAWLPIYTPSPPAQAKQECAEAGIPVAAARAPTKRPERRQPGGCASY